MAGIELRQIDKHYLVDGRRVEVLRGIDLTVPASRITVILGRSGCGKTTLLRLAGGLEQPDGGSIVHGSRSRTAFVFQEPRLMPWLNVTANVAFGLAPGHTDREKLRRVLETVRLTGFEQAYPHQLSGGMQQRCAIARALAYEPDFIMMDEPFAALDHFTREQLQQELIRVQRDRGTGILFVTHSLDEALLLGHRLVVIRDGSILSEHSLPDNSGDRDLLAPPFLALKRSIIRDLHEDERNIL